MTVCIRCVMDSTIPNISFDRNGLCNYCHKYDIVAQRHLTNQNLQAVIDDIKQNHSHPYFHAILGVSGGVDSSYVCYLAWKHGLNLLLLSFDNGWDTETAKHNVKCLIEKTGFAFLKYQPNLDEFHDLQKAYLKASVIDCEVPTDMAIRGFIYQTADEKNINYVLTGSNVVTETVIVKEWSYDNTDVENLLAIHKRFGTQELKTFPMVTPKKLLSLWNEKRIQQVAPLNQINYNQEEAKQFLQEWCGWRDYGDKHCESIWTRFFQRYILPRKWNADKRIMNFSNLVSSGQITREEALAKLKEPLNGEIDKEYVLRGLGLSEIEFEELMNLPKKTHGFYSKPQGVVQERQSSLKRHFNRLLAKVRTQ